jgi:hypothetical protein
MEAAFKRAAYKAIHGTREERSGRFLLAETRKTPSAPLRASKKSKSKLRKG